MGFSIDLFLEEFTQTYLAPFKAEELAEAIAELGMKVSLEEVTDYLDEETFVFPLEQKYYITRAGAFTDKIFCIAPTRMEIEQGGFVVGDRCIPFVNFEKFPTALNFEFMGQQLPERVIEVDCNTARDLYTLFGDEYAAQYIAEDPQNKNLHIVENGCELPSKVKLTGVSLEGIIGMFGFEYGDRLLCRVKNWGKGTIEVFPILNHKLSNSQITTQKIAHAQWFETLEKALLNSFERIGPCASIEEQLANVFYENRNLLCNADCATIHEFLNWSKKIKMQLFGVETRLWKKGEDIPAVGRWNEHYADKLTASITHDYSFAPDFLIDCYLKDFLYEKKNDFSAILNKILPSNLKVSKSDKDYLSLQIKNRSAIIRKQYNWFADFAFGSTRHRALELFTKVDSLMQELDCNTDEVQKLPQTELITLSQLYSHISRILETLSAENERIEDEEVTAMNLSLEGMEYNFEDIRLPLLTAINRIHGDRFAFI